MLLRQLLLRARTRRFERERERALFCIFFISLFIFYLCSILLYCTVLYSWYCRANVSNPSFFGSSFLYIRYRPCRSFVPCILSRTRTFIVMIIQNCPSLAHHCIV